MVWKTFLALHPGNLNNERVQLSFNSHPGSPQFRLLVRSFCGVFLWLSINFAKANDNLTLQYARIINTETTIWICFPHWKPPWLARSLIPTSFLPLVNLHSLCNYELYDGGKKYLATQTNYLISRICFYTIFILSSGRQWISFHVTSS